MKSHRRMNALAILCSFVIPALPIISSGAVLAQGQTQQGQTQTEDPMVRLITRPITPVIKLLLNQEIQQELKLTPEQLDKVKARNEQYQQEVKNRLDLHNRVGQGQQLNIGGDAAQQRIVDLDMDEKRWLAEFLDKDQKSRFDQLLMQYMGPEIIDFKVAGSTLIWPEIGEKLKITSEEKVRFRQIDREVTEAYRTLYINTSLASLQGEEKIKFQEKSEAIKNSRYEKKLASLTAVQQAKWKEMLGEPFKFPAPLQNHWNTPKPQ